MEDLASYRVNVEEPVAATYRGRRVYSCRAPAAGPVVAHMLHILERYDFQEGRTPLNVHRFVEALKCECLAVICAHVISGASEFIVGFAARYAFTIAGKSRVLIFD